MTAKREPVTKCHGCQYHSDKCSCSHQVLYGPDACWKRDGRPERKAGLQNERSPFAGEGEECQK